MRLKGRVAVLENLSTPSLGITEAYVDAIDVLVANFQLPLSGSLASCHLDKSGAWVLSTPSLGITIMLWSLLGSRLLPTFQLPLSGSHCVAEAGRNGKRAGKLSTPSLGITYQRAVERPEVLPFNSLSRDHSS